MHSYITTNHSAIFPASRPLTARLLAFTFFILCITSNALADRAFTARYAVNQNGDMAQIGNTSITCNALSGKNRTFCVAAQNGGNYANNDFYMIDVDIDSDSTTFNSSSATLSLPAGSTVTFAGLYWGGGSNNSARNQALFKTPLSFGYSAVTASVVDVNTTSILPVNEYQSFANVTAQVAAAGNGNYTVANVQTGYGETTHGWTAGWVLIVVFSNNSYPLRNLTVFDGFLYADSSTVTMLVNGFLTPLNGPVVSRFGLITWDGELNVSGEALSFNGTQIGDAQNPISNQFNSTISNLGARISAKNPDYVNQLGLDIDRINIPAGLLGNGATSATLALTSVTNERFWPGAATFTTDIYVPIITPNVVKTVIDVNGGALVEGDTLRWTIALSNTGQDGATNVVVTDNIPAFVTYKPNSLVVASGANSGAKTDTAGNDQAEYIATGTPRVVFRLGTGANATLGGSLSYNQATSITFETTVNSGLLAGTVISNSANIAYTGQTVGDTFSTSSAVALMAVQVPPEITKSFSPNPIAVNDNSVLTIVVRNPASNPLTLTGVTFTDTYPTGLVNSATPNPVINCTAGSTAGTLTGGAANGNTINMTPGATLLANGLCTITVNVTSATTGNYTNVTGAVNSTNGGAGTTATATLVVGKPSISKAFSATSILSGANTTVTFTLTNTGIVPLTGVAFSDPLTNMTVASAPSVTNNCGGTITAASLGSTISLSGGNLAANSSCSITVAITSSVTGVQPNTTTGVSSTQSGAAGSVSNTATLTVVGKPIAEKTFTPSSVNTGQPALLTITISNPNPTTAITGVAFTDTYPNPNLINSTPSNTTLNCTAGSTATLVGGVNGLKELGISAGTLAGGGSCTVTANVQSSSATTYNNSTGIITTTNAGTGTAATASLIVSALTPLTVAKTFTPTFIAINGSTKLKITVTNPAANTVAVSGVSYTDVYPFQMFNTATPSPTITCTTGSTPGTSTATAGGNSVAVSGQTIARNGNCSVEVNVTSPDTALYTNFTDIITTANAGSSPAAYATLNVLAPPIITKTLSPDSIASGGTSVLTITLTNPTSATTSLSGVQITDLFPNGMTTRNVAATKSTDCSGSTIEYLTSPSTWNSTIATGRIGVRWGYSGSTATLAPNKTCTIVLNVTSNVAGSYTNTTSPVTTTNAGTGGTASAILTVARPNISKSFTTSPVAAGVASQLRLTLTNPTGTSMTGATVTDSLPPGMVVAATPSASTACGGTFQGSTDNSSYHTIVAGDTYVRLTGGTIPTGALGCQLNVNVTSDLTATNTIGVGDLTITGPASNGTPTSATLIVYDKPGVSKTFSPSTVLPNAVSTLSITLTNSNAIASGNVTLTDAFPAGMVVATTPAISNTCGGTGTSYQGSTDGSNYHTIVAGDKYIRLNGSAAIPATGTCTISVNVSSSTAGNYLNSTGTVTTASIGNGDANTDILTVMAPPTITKSFSPTSVAPSINSALTITLSNPNAIAITDAAFTDTYPLNLINAAIPNASTSCVGGTVTAIPAGNKLEFSGATIPANSSCTIIVYVNSAIGGSYPNTLAIGALTTSNSGSNAVATSATLTVVAPPLINLIKTSNVTSISPGGDINYTITIKNVGTGNAESVKINDILPFYSGLNMNKFSAGVRFQLVQGTPSSTLALGTPTYSNNNGASYLYTLVSGSGGMPAGFDGVVTNFFIPMTGTMPAGSSFQINYAIKVK